MAEAKKYPAWKAAVDAFLSAGFKEGDVVPHSWFYEAFDLEQPSPTMSHKKASELELKRLKQFERLDNALLNEHQVCLESVPGEGYRVVPPREQSKLGYTVMVDGIRKAIKDGSDIVSNVNQELLTTDTERREHSDYLARTGLMKEMHSRQRRLPAS